MLDTISKPEPSELVKASPLLTKLYASGHVDLNEVERQAQASALLREAFSSSLWHNRNAEGDPDYWVSLYGSQINWWPVVSHGPFIPCPLRAAWSAANPPPSVDDLIPF